MSRVLGYENVLDISDSESSHEFRIEFTQDSFMINVSERCEVSFCEDHIDPTEDYQGRCRLIPHYFYMSKSEARHLMEFIATRLGEE